MATVKHPNFGYLSPYDEQFSKLFLHLTSIGLTTNQAKIYIYLLGAPMSPVRIISKALDLHRVDVYRRLQELQDFGMIEVHFKIPRTYSAIAPKSALATFLSMQEEKINKMKLESNHLINELDEYSRNFCKDRSIESTLLYDEYCSLVVGRRHYYDEIKSLIRNAKSEVLRIVSPAGVIRTFTSGVFDEYMKAKERGVSLRMISQVNSKNRAYVKRLSKAIDVRHMEDIHLRFLVADRLVSVISARFDEGSFSVDSIKDSYLVLKDSKISECFCFFFEHLWNSAKDLGPR
jgi:sugar-specific transcriptional regulator TrmB